MARVRPKNEVPRLVALTKSERDLLANYCIEKLGFIHSPLIHEIARKAIHFALTEKRAEFEEFLKRGG